MVVVVGVVAAAEEERLVLPAAEEKYEPIVLCGGVVPAPSPEGDGVAEAGAAEAAGEDVADSAVESADAFGAADRRRFFATARMVSFASA